MTNTHDSMNYSATAFARGPWLTRVFLAIAAAGMLVCCNGTPPSATSTTSVLIATSTNAPTATPTASSSGLRMPQGYAIPAECRYVDGGTVDGAATAWKISCPQGLPSNYLRPSLTAQTWASCGVKVWQKSGLQISVMDAVNTSGFTGWLDQRPMSAAGCVEPTPPPDGSAGPP